jgi:hypothetical protein
MALIPYLNEILGKEKEDRNDKNRTGPFDSKKTNQLRANRI